ncbi:MAG: S8 family serine peptidase [Candidatus Competibacterales bacterium]
MRTWHWSLAWVSLVVLGPLAGCQTTPPPSPWFESDWRADPTATDLADRELLVTIPLADPADLERTGRALADRYGLEFVAAWPITTIDIHCFVFRLPAGGDMEQLLAQLATDSRVDAAQPMYTFNTLATSYNDRYLALQHGLRSLQIQESHRYATGKGITVGIVDTGVDGDHPELQGNMIRALNLVGDAPSHLAEVHGTAVAGIIGAKAHNGIGIVGVAPEAQLLALRACWQRDTDSTAGACSSFTLARALNVAIVQEVDVLNLSLKGPRDPLMIRLIEAALAKGMTVVAADDPQRPGTAFPATLPGVIAVAAAGQGTGGKVLNAPGVDILTTVPRGGYRYLSGSSLATAHVAGIVALIREVAPDLPPERVTALLQLSARPMPIPGGVGGVTPQVNACVAMALLAEGQGDVPQSSPRAATPGYLPTHHCDATVSLVAVPAPPLVGP